MDKGPLAFKLSYGGSDADHHYIDLYDVAQGLVGFQRSLALTTHLAINDKIITQAPSLKGARIYTEPAGKGSWEIVATIVFGAGVLYKLGTAPKDTPIGHAVYSMYDYTISKILGVRVDYDKSLGQSLEEAKRAGVISPKIDENRVDSLIEKCEPAVKAMHRPISASQTAEFATVSFRQKSDFEEFAELDIDTHEGIEVVEYDEKPRTFIGQVSSYNSNTLKGRIYLTDYNRPVPFQLGEEAQRPRFVGRIVDSLKASATARKPSGVDLVVVALGGYSRTGRLKRLWIVDVQIAPR